MTSVNRRDFLRTGLAGSLWFSTGLPGAAAIPTPAPAQPGRARNLIVLVSDGMSMGTLTLAERFRRRFDGRGTHWLGLYQRPDLRRAFMDTCSADSLVTDSAAASSAWGCGFKVKNGSINITPDGQPRTPLWVLAQKTGRSTGLVTTSRITHATPAGFAAQVRARAEERSIAEQYLLRRIDVLLGGGSKFFAADPRAEQRDLFGEFAQSGYHIARDRSALQKLPATGRVLGLFAHDHLPYALDTAASTELAAATPSLAEMARSALDRLVKNPDGFVLQIEGARIDHAAHANDVGGLVFDQLAFDDAVGEALRFAEGRDDTLVIVTTDHGNANPGLNSTSGPNGTTQACFERLANFRQTNTWVMEGLNEQSSVAQIRERVHAANGIALSGEEAGLLQRALRVDSSPREGYSVRNAPIVTLGQLISNHTSVGWAGVQHTTDLVELAAFGPGSEPIAGLIQNNELFGIMTRALGTVQSQQSAA